MAKTITLLRDFDNCIGEWCNEHKIAYTRYCDDMTFSGDFDPKLVIELVKRELKKLGLYLNEKKTVVIRKGQRQAVTGIIVNENPSVPIEYKKRIRQEMYYCMKFGIADHLRRTACQESEEVYAAKLLGRINYVLSVEPDNLPMQRCRKWLMKYKKEILK